MVPCKLWRAIRQRAGLPRIRYEAAVGSLLASECPNTRGGIRQQAGSHRGFVVRSVANTVRIYFSKSACQQTMGPPCPLG